MKTGLVGCSGNAGAGQRIWRVGLADVQGVAWRVQASSMVRALHRGMMSHAALIIQ